MATYKVLQDIEAEDKLVGPLTLRQFIYALIAAGSLWLSFVSVTKNAAFLLAIFLPVAGITGFFAFPWGQDQPTELWALAKIRFLLKPRRRIWDQSGAKELVTVTVPKHIERILTNGLDQEEVRSRLSALASTIDSRGWAIKNINVNMSTTAAVLPDTSDRLVAASSLPQEVSNVDIRASDDILDASANPIAQHFDSMIAASATAHHQKLVSQMQQPAAAPTQSAPAPSTTPPPTNAPAGKPADFWFMQPPASTAPGQATFVDTPVIVPGTQALPVAVPQAATPTAEEQALIEKLKAENSSQTVAYGHLKTLKTPQQLLAEEAANRAAAATKPVVTPDKQAVIMNLSNNDDLSVAAIARQAHQEVEQGNDGEVVISLH
ncbi:MAG TPA: PrgI family protein [Candidatus Saccharimonadales bacterium]|nr:PrgI family protein [Candidatus Saccharimonadales bacterium]